MLVARPGERSDDDIPRPAYRLDRSYAWNYAHAPTLPRVRRLPAGPGGKLFHYTLNSRLGVAAGPLLNSKWVEGYARLGFDILTYATVRSRFHPAHSLPNIRYVENREQLAVIARRTPVNGDQTIAVSLGLPSMAPDVWRKDVRRAKERIGPGQILIVSVVGTPDSDSTAESFVVDYAQCAAWAAEAGADVIEVHLAVPNPFGDSGHMVYEHVPLAAQILHRVRTTISIPIVAKFGLFRNARALHDTATKLAAWVNGFVLVQSIQRRVVDADGKAGFEGEGRELAEIVGAETFVVASRQIAELLAWRKAGAWNHAVLAVGGIASADRARAILREGADAALVATAALFDPLLPLRFRQAPANAA